jgi:hypothetical protein
MEAWRQWLLGGKEVFSAKIKNTHYEPRIPLTPTGLLMEGHFAQNRRPGDLSAIAMLQQLTC